MDQSSWLELNYKLFCNHSALRKQLLKNNNCPFHASLTNALGNVQKVYLANMPLVVLFLELSGRYQRCVMKIQVLTTGKLSLTVLVRFCVIMLSNKCYQNLNIKYAFLTQGVFRLAEAALIQTVGLVQISSLCLSFTD